VKFISYQKLVKSHSQMKDLNNVIVKPTYSLNDVIMPNDSSYYTGWWKFSHFVPPFASNEIFKICLFCPTFGCPIFVPIMLKFFVPTLSYFCPYFYRKCISTSVISFYGCAIGR
jgi:hypothetical protein